jgi:type III pantothenate kinase
MTVLTIDSGNSRIKWGLFDAMGALIEHSAFPHNDLVNVRFPPADKVIISNVAGPTIELQLNQKLDDYPLVQWLTSKQSALGVTNHYAIPEKLGTDRWAALIAAWHHGKKACLVVNAGTAVTIDAVDNEAAFLGGMILPGLDLMQRSLNVATAQLPYQAQNQDAQIQDAKLLMFATSTEEAMASGAMHAICGAITNAALTLQKTQGTAPAILLSGGNAYAISQHLETISQVTKPVIVDNLVLQGLYLLATK